MRRFWVLVVFLGLILLIDVGGVGIFCGLWSVFFLFIEKSVSILKWVMNL